MHRTSSAQVLNGEVHSHVLGQNAGAISHLQTSPISEGANLSSSKMREKLAALEDLNELLEEPVEEQVRQINLWLTFIA